MTRQEMLDAAELFKAAAEGRKIQWKYQGDARWLTPPKGADSLAFNFAECEYRIQPDKEYRPYRDLREFCRGYLENQDGGLVANRFETGNSIILDRVVINRFDSAKGVSEPVEIDMETLLKNYTWPTGKPCGVEIK